MKKRERASYLSDMVAVVQLHNGTYWEGIAAFNSQTVAEGYAAECQASVDKWNREGSRLAWRYRVLDIS